ncbi:MAG: D-alanine--D-alanine ligase [Gammaproteobacteria bacterium]|nr:D-alanine--D-alanine ligase [Gammaproteobacteria bacterium]
MIGAATYGPVAVLMGGRSAERAISLLSGRAVLESLRRSGVDAHGIDVDGDLFPRLAERPWGRVFNALHGRGGEDGTVQGVLELMGIPYTGSGVLASALAMDKLRTKQIWQAIGIATPAWRVLGDVADLAAVAADPGFPVMVKPVREGSSIGMARADDPAGLERAWREARRYDDVVLAEQWVDGPEYTAAVLGERVLPFIRLETPRGFYDYQAKYEADTTRYHCPCGLAPAAEEAVAGEVMAAFCAIDGRGWGRVDMMRDRAGRFLFIEVNTIPGMTDHSLVPMAARAAGLSFDALVLDILEGAHTEMGAQ